MKKFSLLILCCIAFIFTNAQLSQKNYSVLFKSGTVQLRQNVAEIISTDDLKQFDAFNNRFYLLLQFSSVPTPQQRSQIADAGINLMAYIPHYAFFASVPVDFNPQLFAVLDVRSVSKIDPKYKLNPQLQNGFIPVHASREKGTVDLAVLYFSDLSKETAVDALIKAGGSIIKTADNVQTITVRIKDNMVEEIAALPFVEYVEAIAPPPTPDDFKGRSLHRSNYINNELNGGLKYNGNGVHVAIADDGSISHIDFQGRWTDHTNTGQGGNHGDMTSGICVGAGNLDPTMQGMANGAHLHIFDIGSYPQIIDAVSNYNNYGIVVVSTSYSQGCNEYTSDTQFGDGTIHDNPQLEFVFSAGNNNGNDCGYGAGGQWGNITGGYKQGKNVIACANLDANSVLDNTSSHGPASDGRVKPDISANGAGQMSTDENNGYQVGGGTSAASPGVAGVCAQLYQAYREMHGGQDINTALLKACVLNTANEIGNPGPDYKYGWGTINAKRAYEALANNNYAFDSVTQGQQKTFNINVPANAARIKVMVYWHDYEGNPAASKALVNDLNITLTDPSANVLLPLILNPTPNATTLNAAAVPGVDTLNNVEQVVATYPVAGTYTLTVDGFEVPQGPQNFYVVWDVIDDGITVTYPNGAEGFVSGEQETIRWDASESSQTITLEYSLDNGATWNPIVNNLPPAQRHYGFTVPATSSDLSLIRVTRGTQSDVSDTPFSIFPAIQNLVVLFECPDSVGLQWTPVAGAVAYEASMLGTMYMDSVATSTGSTVTIHGTNPNVDKWFSVRAIGSSGNKGRRVEAIFKPAGTINCPLALDNEMLNLVSPVTGTYRDCPSNGSVPVTIHFRSLSINPVSNFPVNYQFNNGPVVTETFSGTLNTFDTASYTFTVPVSLLPAGIYTLSAWISLPGDMNVFNDSAYANITVIDGNIGVPPLIEDLETSFPPYGFAIGNPDNDYTWEERIVTGATGTITTTAFVNNYSYNAPGEEDYFETRVYDLTGFTAATLTFDVAYAAYSAVYEDALRVDVSTNCGGNFIPTGYLKQGLTLSTIPNYSTAPSWQPAGASEWRNDTVDLSAFAGQPVIVRFVNMCQYGNSLHIDNINITAGITGINEQQNANAVVVYPNPAKDQLNVYFKDASNEPVRINLIDASGRIVKTLQHNFTMNANLQMDVSKLAKGVYTVELSTQTVNSKTRVVLY